MKESVGGVEKQNSASTQPCRRSYLIDHGESNSCRGWQRAGEVLHHALQPRGALEGLLAGVLVLGVDKLGDHALRLLPGGRVRLHAQDQLIDVACRISHGLIALSM